ncbi:hypothetical protein [Natronobacterium texcoconense]|uniref:Uncharacterized protein n=1 Tax=Natronobacterium texcoconense TaxID=1095778 RepID=A0A1H1FZP9_NATTX|nr:hypothetical protein [Natronobacterium texcoconense]SDR06259.1 hypothetical protein SAMN04489842_2183 [Natronobacterium texcoconense]
MKRSLTRETLVEETTAELLAYLLNGEINTTALTQSLDYEGLDIRDWDRIKRIHFCLTEDVQDFITALPDRIRRIKTEHQREHVETQGEVRGSIDWSSTLRDWSDTGYADQSRYVCDTPYTEYNIPENRVLKRLLWKIHRTVTTELEDIDYDWRREYWTDEQINQFSRLYKQNVHLNRITDGQRLTVTGQDLTAARRSRLTLYNDAHALYDTFERLHADRFDPDIVELLGETLIAPTSTPRLFELFCVFRITRLLNEYVPGFQLQPIDGDTGALATLKTDDQRIEIYHDATGNLSFHEVLDADDPPEHSAFKRYYDSVFDYRDVLSELTGDKSDPVLYRGRPDVIIEIYETGDTVDQLQSVLIGEIKESEDYQVFKQGLEELLRYRQFATHEGYLIESSDVSVSNLLITNGVQTSGVSDVVTHLNGKDLVLAAENSDQESEWLQNMAGALSTSSVESH